MNQLSILSGIICLRLPEQACFQLATGPLLSNKVKEIENDYHGEKFFCGIMIYNTYSMDAMGLDI